MLRAVVIAASVVFGLAACGGADSPSRSAEPAQSGSPRPVAAAPASRCPLTAEQVGRAVNAVVTGPDASCSFFPPESASSPRPNAAFVNQHVSACSEQSRADVGYTERLDTLGTTAYVADMADGSWVLVCREGAPFEIRVDYAGAAESRAAAAALAREVLAMR